MVDVFSTRKRAVIMARVRGRGNKRTELAFLSILRRHKITGWRRHRPVFGKPDFVFSKSRLAIFVDGCFWHGCPLHASKPTTNTAFWEKKLSRNKARDCLVNRELRQRGWRILRIWQHELIRKNEGHLLRRIYRYLILPARTEGLRNVSRP